jgi:hypothetical protein
VNAYQMGVHLVDGLCACEVCSSSCDVIFLRHNRHQAVAIDAEEKKNAKKQQGQQEQGMYNIMLLYIFCTSYIFLSLCSFMIILWTA